MNAGTAGLDNAPPVVGCGAVTAVAAAGAGAMAEASVFDTATSTETAARVQALVRDVMAELRPSWADRPVTLDSQLDRDLGFDSLGRGELIARIEQAFAVALPDAVLAAAETPRDLADAVAAAAVRAPHPAAAAAPVVAAAPAGATRVPTEARTLVEVLAWHAAVHPERPHVRLVADEGDGEVLTYGALAAAARRIAAGLQERGLTPGDAVGIMLPTSHAYFACFLGVLLAGGVAVPLYPPTRLARLEEHLNRQAGILANCRARILVAAPEAATTARLVRAQAPDLDVVVAAETLAGETGTPSVPVISTDDVALLQYTSGSTGAPKGVVLSHANLLANIRAMAAAIGATPDDVFVSWLPLYHDMGLIGAWLGCLHHGTPLVLMPSLAFLARPRRWLAAIHRWRGSISGGPNFAYELCLRRLGDDDLAGLDLSCWRVAFNGAEPVSPDTVERFCARFAACGFSRRAMMPVYGLAECSVGLAFPPAGRGPLIDRVRRDRLERAGRAEPAAADQDALAFVACGGPLVGHQIRIADAAGREQPERHEGRIQFQGPSATRGYRRNAEATARLFDGPWLDSGDQGYLAGGELFVTGRRADIVIRGGRNIYPGDVEAAVAGLDGVAGGQVAVFGHAGAGTERLVVVVETRRQGPDQRTRLARAVDEAVTDHLGEPADDVVLVPPGSIPRTSSGKIRRNATAQLYRDRRLGRAPAAPWLQVVRFVAGGAAVGLRRWAGSAAALLYAVRVWALIGVLGPPAWLAAVAVPGLDRRWRLLAAGARLLARLAGIPVVVRGRENLDDPDRPAILACNHASYTDVVVLMAALPRPVAFVTKAELARSPWTRWPLVRLGALFVERFDARRGLDDHRAVARAAAGGRSPLFFPEGTFRRMPGLLPFHMGAFVTAVETGLVVVPMAIRGTRSILRSGSWLPRRGAVTLTVLPALPPPADGRRWQRAVRLRDGVRRAILAHTGEPDLEAERVQW
jgi:1-acyl-sn-glycerol-3-phosphate acyltransferase